MKFNPNEDFNQNVSKLLTLLRNMLKNHKLDNKELNDFFGKKDINLNLCFFTFLPYSFDELDELDVDDLNEEALNETIGKKKDSDELKFEINNTDLDFLKEHGLKF